MQHVLDIAALRGQGLNEQRWRPASSAYAHAHPRLTLGAAQTPTRALASERHRRTARRHPDGCLHRRNSVHRREPRRPRRLSLPSPLPRCRTRPSLGNARDPGAAQAILEARYLSHVCLQRAMAKVHVTTLLLGLRRMARPTRPTRLQSLQSLAARRRHRRARRDTL